MKNVVWMNRLALILTALIFSHLLLYTDLLILGVEEFFVRDNFFRWDSGYYLDIAEKGLFIEYCDGEFSKMLRVPYRCGTAGWFPGYSYLISLLNLLIDNLALAGMIISKLFFILNLLLFMSLAKLSKYNSRGILLVLCFAVFFGSIYYHAIFPISQFIFFALAAIQAFKNEKIYLVSLFSFAACLTYSTGFLLGVILSLSLFIYHYHELKTNFLRIILPGLASFFGLICHFTTLHFTTAHWNAFLLVQGRYGHKPRNPLEKVQQILESIPEQIGELTIFISIQSLLVLFAFGMIVFYFVKKKLYHQPLLLVSFCYLAVYLLFPYSIGSDYLSLYRAESLLVPMLFFIAKLPRRFILLIFIVLLLVNLPMNHLFFQGILV